MNNVQSFTLRPRDELYSDANIKIPHTDPEEPQEVSCESFHKAVSTLRGALMKEMGEYSHTTTEFRDRVCVCKCIISPQTRIAVLTNINGDLNKLHIFLNCLQQETPSFFKPNTYELENDCCAIIIGDMINFDMLHNDDNLKIMQVIATLKTMGENWNRLHIVQGGGEAALVEQNITISQGDRSRLLLEKMSSIDKLDDLRKVAAYIFPFEYVPLQLFLNISETTMWIKFTYNMHHVLIHQKNILDGRPSSISESEFNLDSIVGISELEKQHTGFMLTIAVYLSQEQRQEKDASKENVANVWIKEESNPIFSMTNNPILNPKVTLLRHVNKKGERDKSSFDTVQIDNLQTVEADGDQHSHNTRIWLLIPKKEDMLLITPKNKASDKPTVPYSNVLNFFAKHRINGPESILEKMNLNA